VDDDFGAAADMFGPTEDFLVDAFGAAADAFVLVTTTLVLLETC